MFFRTFKTFFKDNLVESQNNTKILQVEKQRAQGGLKGCQHNDNKTMANDDDTQNYPFSILKLVVEKIKHLT